jgi:hypothetical protein
MKKEVYSWRVSTEVKSDLEREARLRKTSVSSVLDQAVRDWLKKSRPASTEDEEQRRLHALAEKCLGAFAGGNSRRAEAVREVVRQRVRRRYGR